MLLLTSTGKQAFIVGNIHNAKNLLERQSIKQLCDICSPPLPPPCLSEGLRCGRGHEGSLAVTREPGAGADNRVQCWPADRSEVELQIVITGSGFTLTPSQLLCSFFCWARVCLRGEIGTGAGDASEGQRELTRVLWPHRKPSEGLETQLQSGECARWQWQWERNERLRGVISIKLHGVHVPSICDALV